MILCLDVPDDAFDEHEVGEREFLVPADVLNSLGKPSVYDHEYAGSSRRELLQAAEFWEETGGVQSFQHGDGMRSAIQFFDEIGWLTPLRLEEGE